MITSLFLLQLIGFQLWYLTSKQVKTPAPTRLVKTILAHPPRFRALGLALIGVSTILLVAQWGLMTGLCVSLVGIMGIGCLTVLLQPFGYLNSKNVAAMYLLFLAFELFIS